MLKDTWHRHPLLQEQTTMKRATYRFIDGNKDADKFNSKFKYSMQNAETSNMKKKL
jgi:hypothetical protein